MNKLTKLLSALTSGGKRTATVKKNILASFLIRGWSIVVSLMLVPMTLGYLSSELYGVWLTLSSVILWLGFFDVGFTLGLKNKLAEAIALNDWERGKCLVSTTYFMMFAIFIPLCILLEFSIEFVDWASFLNIDPKYNEDISKALYAIILFFCLNMILHVLGSVIAAFQQVAFSNAFPVISHTISLVVIYILIKTVPPSLTILSLTISAIPVVVYLVSSVILYKTSYKKVAPSIQHINTKYISDLFTLGFKFFLIQTQVIVFYQTTNFLISNLSGPNDVTYYNIAYKYLSIAMMVYNIILAPLWPAFTDAYTKKDYKWMNNIYSKMTKLYILLAVILIAMVIISPIAYKIWIGNRATIPFAMTSLVALYIIIHNWDALQVYLINGTGCIKLQTYVTMIGLICHIPFSYFLGRYIGGYGVVCSMIIINFIYVVFFTIQIRKILKQQATGIWIK